METDALATFGRKAKRTDALAMETDRDSCAPLAHRRMHSFAKTVAVIINTYGCSALLFRFFGSDGDTHSQTAACVA